MEEALMTSIVRLRRKFAKSIGSVEARSLERAKVGKVVPGGYIVDVADMPGKIYVRIEKNGGISLTTAINRGSPIAISDNDDENVVWLRRDPKSGDYEVVRRMDIVDVDQPVKAFTMPPHTHNKPGNYDPVSSIRILPGLVQRKASGLTVLVRQFVYKSGSGYAFFPQSNFDLTSYLPATDYYHAWVVVGFDPGTATLTAQTGTEYPTTTELDESHIEAMAISFIPLMAIKLKNGQTQPPTYADMIDMRNWFATTEIAPGDARFWVSTASSALSNETNMGALTTGLVYHTVSGGVSTPSTATSAQVVGAIDAAAIPSNKLAAIDYLEFSDTSVPSTPAANRLRQYAVDVQGKTELFIIDDQGFKRNLARDLVITVYNPGAVINYGNPVRVQNAFSSTNKPQIYKAQADSLANCEGILGITIETISGSGYGRVLIAGITHTANTSAFSVGDTLYVNPTVAGTLVSFEPTPPDIARRVGVVLKVGTTDGEILWQPGEPELRAGTDYVQPNSGSNVINTNMITDSAVTDAKIATLTATKLRGTSGRLIKLAGTGSAATELAGTNTGDILRWGGSSWDAARPGFAEMIAHTAIAGSDATITLSNLSTLNSNFTHLMIMLMLRSNVAGVRDALMMTFNGVTTASQYTSFNAKATHSATLTTFQNLASSESGIKLDSVVPGDSATGSYFGIIKITVFNYRSTALFKNVVYESFAQWGTTTGLLQTQQGGGQWLSTSAITSILIAPNNGSGWKVASTYSLYGIGGA
jgi:hypothetical protein